MARCKNCIHFGICKKGFPWSDGKGDGWCEDFKNKANFVEVVRCKNCIHSEYDKAIDEYYCEMTYCSENENHFCSYGERKQ